MENKSLERHSNDDKCNPMIIPERAENKDFGGFPGCVNPNTCKSHWTIGALSIFYVGNFCALMGILVGF